jgi:hypothetical protein
LIAAIEEVGKFELNPTTIWRPVVGPKVGFTRRRRRVHRNIISMLIAYST